MCEMSIEILHCLKRKRDICIRNIIPSQNTALTPGAFFSKTHFLNILEIFSLDMGQVNSSLLKTAFATQQHSFLSTITAFYDILPGHAQKSKFARESERL